MLIPSIDLMDGRVVQLRRGAELMLASDDLDGWLQRFSPFPLIQVIDLDAARGRGHNAALVRDICRARPCQLGGGIRSIQQAEDWVKCGAARVILGSVLFDEPGVDLEAAAGFAEAIGPQQLVAAVDASAGRVVTHGWTRRLQLAPVDAARTLEPYVGAFLYTHVDNEGTMSGFDMTPALALRAATTRQLIVAGGIRSWNEVDLLDREHIDAVVGMSIYTGLMPISS